MLLQSKSFRAVYLLVYNWSWYVSFRAGIYYFAFNPDIFQNLFFVKSPYYSLFFDQKKRFKMKFCKTVKITIVRPSHFDRPRNFFLHPRQLMVVFTVFANFLVVILPRKKTILCGKIFFCFLVISEPFFESVANCPQKKTRYQKKK